MELEVSVRASAATLASAIASKDGVQRAVLVELAPVLVDGFADLLQGQSPVRDPLVQLALYLMRHNPRHARSAPSKYDEDVVRDAYLRQYKQSLIEAIAKGNDESIPGRDAPA